MSLQMPPEGRGYSRVSADSERQNEGQPAEGEWIVIPRDVHAKTREGHSFQLPRYVSRESCDFLPASVAEDNCAFPLAVDAQRLTLLLPDDVDEHTIVLLEFVLNRPLEIVLAPRERVARLVRIAYGTKTGERQVASCGGKFRARCTLDWNDLLPTSESSVRFCADCSRPVYYCADDEELRLRSAAGQCAAVDLLKIEASDGGVTMGLIEFVDSE